jgi:hypothetical protein
MFLWLNVREDRLLCFTEVNDLDYFFAILIFLVGVEDLSDVETISTPISIVAPRVREVTVASFPLIMRDVRFDFAHYSVLAA